MEYRGSQALIVEQLVAVGNRCFDQHGANYDAWLRCRHEGMQTWAQQVRDNPPPGCWQIPENNIRCDPQRVRYTFTGWRQ